MQGGRKGVHLNLLSSLGAGEFRTNFVTTNELTILIVFSKSSYSIGMGLDLDYPIMKVFSNFFLHILLI